MSEHNYWVVIPAAGVGKRMQADRPKQYLPLAGRTVIEHTLSRFDGLPQLRGIVVALSEGDPYWPRLDITSSIPLYTTLGGDERCHSVLNALQRLSVDAADSDWVLVHDAARPCLRPEDISKLIDTLADDPVGGLLGLPLADTVKRVDSDGRVEDTVPREALWRALTPQMFRLGSLREALDQAMAEGFLVTDEASAIEHAGLAPRMVEGHGDNIKVTRPEDLQLAALYLGNMA